MQYQEVKDPSTQEVTSRVIKLIEDDGTIRSVPNDEGNKDWRAYQAWLALGNTPEAAD